LFPAEISDLTTPNQPVIPSEDARALASIATRWRASQSRDLQLPFASTVSRYRIYFEPDSNSGAGIPISYQPHSRTE